MIAVDERVAQMKVSNKKLKDVTNQSSVAYIRRELGVDVGEKERQQLVPEMIESADLTVVIPKKSISRVT